jgi:D-aminopeptidase
LTGVPCSGAARGTAPLRSLLAGALVAALPLAAPAAPAPTRPRARDLGLHPGRFEPGRWNAITDVAGVRVGHVTLVAGDDVRTGVTAILPHGGNLFRDKVAGAVYVFNAFGKLVGSTQVEELGEIETPIVLTNTLSVWDAARGLVDWTLKQPGNEDVRSVNPVVGETNDGWLNDIRGRHVRPEHVLAALEAAREGPFALGSVGAGTGTMALGWKGGIGTSSRRLGPGDGGFTLGVLVQSNFGGTLTMAGVPVGRELAPPPRPDAGGSCMMVVATDAPLDARQLRRLAARAVHGMARAGASGSHGSGDYVIAFSTTRCFGPEAPPPPPPVDDARLSPLFEAVAEATEEAIIDSLLQATTVYGRDGHTAPALPIAPLRALLRRAGR